jgi:hypothetical protein
MSSSPPNPGEGITRQPGSRSFAPGVPPPTRPSSMRITREEAMSSHVDDLLQRQKSLRGEEASRGQRRWYYQNWFVFLIAGSISAFAAWALLEPYYNDMSYIQGPVQRVDLNAPLPPLDDPTGAIRGQGYVVIQGETIWLLDSAKQQMRDGSWEKLNRSDLAHAGEIGVHLYYVSLIGGTETHLSLGEFVVYDPPPQSIPSLETQQTLNLALSLFLFSIVGGIIGLSIGAADGLVCRLFRRALLAGGVGMLVGAIGGFLSGIIANLVYAPINTLAMSQGGYDPHAMTMWGFSLQIVGRSLAWGLAGMTMGLGQGFALRSRRLLLYGFLGGLLGGIFGGLLFDPIDFLLIGLDKPSSHWSRLVGIVCVGGMIGLMIGLVELLARDAWLRMTQGPLAGKEFLVFKDVMKIGSSPHSDIYLFNDPLVARSHATIRAVGDNCEIENFSQDQPTRVNDQPVLQRRRLRHGDRIGLGKTEFVFQRRKGG